MAKTEKQLKDIVEAALFASEQPLTVDRLLALFIEEHDRPTRDEVRQVLNQLVQDYEGKGLELKEVSSGFRFQVRSELAPWIARLWEEKPPRYSRALLETLALIAYRQPITRAEIEDVRGVSVSSGIIKTLTERNWVKVVGHKDLPGKPALYATTREFLDYFNLKSLDQLPTLSELKEFEAVNEELDLEGGSGSDAGSSEAQDDMASSAASSGEAVSAPAEGESKEQVEEEAEISEEEGEIVTADALVTDEETDDPEADMMPPMGKDSAGRPINNSTV